MLLWPADAHSADTARKTLRLGTGSIEVAYHPGDIRLARHAGEAAQYGSERIARWLGIALETPVAVFLARGREEFNRMCGASMQPWALAAASRRKRCIVVDAALVVPASANDMGLAIIHEITHLALFQVEENQPLPLWFHEGVATWLSQRRHVLTDRRDFNLAAAQGALIPLERLERTFPDTQSEAALAYLQSEAFVGHLVATCSAESLRWILDRYTHGEPFEQAFANALGISRARMEKRWRRSFKSGFPWLRVIWHATTLFGVLALMTIVAFVIVRLRARRQHQRWKEEEAMWGPAEADSDAAEDEL